MGGIHTFVTHFPIVLILTAMLFQLSYIRRSFCIDRRMPLGLFGLGVVLVILSIFSGQETATVGYLDGLL